MTIRLWFSSEDLARTRVTPPDPLAETVLSMFALRGGAHPDWRRRTRPRLPPPVLPLTGIVPGPEPMLDLFSVAGRQTHIDEGLDRLLSARSDVLTGEVDYFADAHGRLPRELGRMLAPVRGAPRPLAAALRTYHDVAVGPYWPRLRAHLHTQRQHAALLIAEGGWERLLTALEPAGLRWQAPVLEIPSARTREHRLDGRGLLLAPSAFCPRPILSHDVSGTHPCVLMYPAAPEPVAAAQLWAAPGDRALTGLLGGTRARILAAAAGGATTSELARRAHVAVSSASEHARVLRDAGILTAERRGGTVHHTLTELGGRLLDRHG